MEQPQHRYRTVRLYLENGSVLGHHYEAPEATSAVLWLGGVGGGFDSPAHDLFDRLAADFTERGISSLRIRYRLPTDFEWCIEDALVGIEFIRQTGLERVALVGYSLGGAVAIQAGAAAPSIAAVAVIASQSYGTGAANRIAPRPLLIIQGENDQIISPDCATYIYEHALEPKQIVLIPNADHCFDHTGSELQDALEKFLIGTLIQPAEGRQPKAA